MDKIWDRKSFKVGCHWPLWRGWKNWMTTQNLQKLFVMLLNKEADRAFAFIPSRCYKQFPNSEELMSLLDHYTSWIQPKNELQFQQIEVIESLHWSADKKVNFTKNSTYAQGNKGFHSLGFLDNLFMSPMYII